MPPFALPLLPALLAACADTAFYDDPVDDLDAYAPGDVVRIEPIATVPAATLSWKAGTPTDTGATVYRVLYRTTGLDGAADVASARVAVPDLAEPAGGFPVVAHLHGTLGMADACAPSREGGFGFESSGNPNAARMVAAGRVVVEPDYLGLGTPGPHPYTAAEPTAWSVLDAIRAAGDFGGTGPIAIEGHSQGGHAVLATLAHAATYAPELDVRAAVAIAAPGAPADVFAALAGEGRWGGFLAMSTLGMLHAHPDAGEPETWLRDPDDLAARLEEDCLVALSDVTGAPPAALFHDDVVEAAADGDFAGLDGVLAAEDLGGLATDVPHLMVHGTADDLLPMALTEAYAARMRAAGTAATFLPVAGGDHLFLPWTAREEVWAWLEARL